jgi:sulfite reductase (NADPH) flavoprotein alpha-component
MLRALHRWPGLLALTLVTLLAISGAALSVFPAAERLGAPQAAPDLTVGALVERIAAIHPGVEDVKRSPTGQITASWTEGGKAVTAVIDPATGQAVGSAQQSPVERWLVNLHRSLLLGDTGRIAMAIGAAAMLVMSLSGIVMVARRAGGWRRWFAPLRGTLASRLHVEIARLSVVALIFSSITALWMTAATFDLLPRTGITHATFATSDRPNILRTTPVAELRSLTLPEPGAANAKIMLKTTRGSGVVDSGTGALLTWTGLGPWQQLSETISNLHTGRGAAALGVLLGLMALGVPVMGGTGVALWLGRRLRCPHLHGNHPAARAETIILVGSENGSTWGFAATLHRALTAAGQSVHVGAMSAFAPGHYGQAQRILVLAATSGDGDAPLSAQGFLERAQLLDQPDIAPLAILGFGDRNFPNYCGFAEAVVQIAAAKGWPMLMPFDTVDRQSPQDFARWGQRLGQLLGLPLELNHQPVPPVVAQLTLISRRDYGAEVQAPTAILRFAVPQVTRWQRLTGRGFGRFLPGDLLGITPAGSDVPRFYSLASGARDGFVEIVVRKQIGGLCSGQLLALRPGDTVGAFLRPNPGFRTDRGAAPLILIGAGAGIGPLAGFIRANRKGRPMHLFFGLRHPDSDFLYGEELTEWQLDGRLARLSTAMSRGARPHYVQDALRMERAQVVQQIRDGARIMVCGGREMANGVGAALSDILTPLGLSPAALKEEGRYVEDVY